MSKMNAVIRLRRDNDYNYAKIKDKFIPANGEICLVDTARDGLQAICGDGKTLFANLEYMNNFIIKGYYFTGQFYKDSSHTDIISGSTLKIYIDLHEGTIYHYNGETYKNISPITAAS